MAFWELQVSFVAEDADDNPARFEVFLDAIVDELAELGFDVDYAAVAAKLEASFTIEVDDASENGLIRAVEALQTAVATVVGDAARAANAHELTSTRKLVLA